MRPHTTLDTADELMRAQAERSVAIVIHAGADLMVKNPRRILLALYPFVMAAWPGERTLVELLADCRGLIRAETDLARRGQEPDWSALMSFRAAEEALVRLLSAPLASIEEAARWVA